MRLVGDCDASDAAELCALLDARLAAYLAATADNATVSAWAAGTVRPSAAARLLRTSDTEAMAPRLLATARHFAGKAS